MSKRPQRRCSIKGCTNSFYGRGYCSKHYKRWWKHGDPLSMSFTRPSDGATEKCCPRCEQTKSVDDFGFRSGKDSVWLNSHCKACRRDEHLIRRYGITWDDYTQMLQRQDGCCAICGTTQHGGRNSYFSVDHCHETGAVRGLLCTHCNTALGYMADDPNRLLSAATYLIQHQTRQEDSSHVECG